MPWRSGFIQLVIGSEASEFIVAADGFVLTFSFETMSDSQKSCKKSEEFLSVLHPLHHICRSALLSPRPPPLPRVYISTAVSLACLLAGGGGVWRDGGHWGEC